MNALYKDYSAKGLAIVAIATDAGGKAVVAPFMQAHGLTFPVLLDQDGRWSELTCALAILPATDQLFDHTDCAVKPIG